MKPRRRKDSGLLGKYTTPRPYSSWSSRSSSSSSLSPLRTRLDRYFKILAIVLLLWTAVEVYLIRNAIITQSSVPIPQLGTEKIFIASMAWTNELVLRSHWVPAVTELAKTIGRENAFVSVYESGSLDDSKGALRELDHWLGEAGISRKIVLDETTHLDEISAEPGPEGWIKLSNGTEMVRRIPYLARLREKVLEPLYEMQEAGLKFDKILWLNDVVFDKEDVRRLLATRGGDYAAACALDFADSGAFYDTFALRDADGREGMMSSWPFFRSRKSRRALKASEPVPVQSCWNGIIAMDAEAFYGGYRSLAFRGISDSLAKSHLEASECCLIHADNPMSRWKGAWVNPNVRVGYNAEAYEAVHTSAGSSWISVLRMFYGVWMNRILRWTTTTRFKEGATRQRLEDWKGQSNRHFESGDFCLINEMQVLTEVGWAHL